MSRNCWRSREILTAPFFLGGKYLPVAHTSRRGRAHVAWCSGGAAAAAASSRTWLRKMERCSAVELRRVGGDLGEERVGGQHGRLVAMAGVGVAQQRGDIHLQRPGQAIERATASASPCRSRSWRCRCAARPCARRAGAAKDCGRGEDRGPRWQPGGLPASPAVGAPARWRRLRLGASRLRDTCGNAGTWRWLCGIAPDCSGRNGAPPVVRRTPSWLP